MRITYGGDEDELPTHKRDLPGCDEDDERFRTVVRPEQPTLDLEDVELVSAELEISLPPPIVELTETEPIVARAAEPAPAPASRMTMPIATAPTPAPIPAPLPTAPPPPFVLQPAQPVFPVARPSPAPVPARAPKSRRLGAALAVLGTGVLLGAGIGVNLEPEAVASVTKELLPGTATPAPKLSHAPGARAPAPASAVSWQPSASNPSWTKR